METGQVSGRIRLIRGLRDSSVTASVFRCIGLTLGSDPDAHKSACDLHKGGINPRAIKITCLMSRTHNLWCPKVLKRVQSGWRTCWWWNAQHSPNKYKKSSGSFSSRSHRSSVCGRIPRDLVLNDSGCHHGNVNLKRPITPSETLSVAWSINEAHLQSSFTRLRQKSSYTERNRLFCFQRQQRIPWDKAPYLPGCCSPAWGGMLAFVLSAYSAFQHLSRLHGWND